MSKRRPLFLRVFPLALFLIASLAGAARSVEAQTLAPQERLCDPAFQDCREDILRYIQQETVAIDMAFWLMTDARYSNELVKAWRSRPLDEGRFLANVANHCDLRCRVHRCMACCGVRSPRQRRGRSFSSAAMLSSWSPVQALRSVPFGKYCRSRPLVFSLVGRCQGECGSAE